MTSSMVVTVPSKWIRKVSSLSIGAGKVFRVHVLFVVREYCKGDVEKFGLPFCEEEQVVPNCSDVLHSALVGCGQPLSDLLQVGLFDVSQPAIPTPTFYSRELGFVLDGRVSRLDDGVYVAPSQVEGQTRYQFLAGILISVVSTFFIARPYFFRRVLLGPLFQVRRICRSGS